MWKIMAFVYVTFWVAGAFSSAEKDVADSVLSMVCIAGIPALLGYFAGRQDEKKAQHRKAADAALEKLEKESKIIDVPQTTFINGLEKPHE